MFAIIELRSMFNDDCLMLLVRSFDVSLDHGMRGLDIGGLS